MRKKRIKSSFYVLAILVFSFIDFYRAADSYGLISEPSKQAVIVASNNSLIVDGKLDDKVWQSLEILNLKPAEPGVPEKGAANSRVVLRGNHLCLGGFIPEPGGKVIARSIGYNPIWHRNPPAEDLLVYELKFRTKFGQESVLRLEINPWGAHRILRDGKLVQETKILIAANVTPEGWGVETVVPLDELNLDESSDRIKINISQSRCQRPVTPFLYLSLPSRDDFLEFSLPGPGNKKTSIAAPRYDPPFLGPDDPPLQVGSVQVVPPIDMKWDDPFWGKVPGITLPRDEPNPRRPDFPTELKWVQDGKTLSLFFKCTDDEPLDCDMVDRDGNVQSDDHVFIHLATTGSAAVQILVNPVGAVWDARATGPNMAFWANAWDGKIKTHYLLISDAWYLRVDLPLDEIAEALGESCIPKNWRIFLGRTRQARVGSPREISSIPVIENTFYGAPARYGRLILTDIAPGRFSPTEPIYKRPRFSGLAGELAELESCALTRVQRKYFDVSGMLRNDIARRIKLLAMEEHAEWDSAQSLEDWERFRDKRLEALKSSLGEFPETRCPLNYQETGTYRGDGYQVKNVFYQSRQGFYVTGNLYLPENPTDNMPAIILIPSHHYHKPEVELRDCGMIWARTGCAVLVIDRLGCGERNETIFWNRQGYTSEYLLEMQLDLIGQSRIGWMAWDISRAVDLLYEMGNIDRKRIILIGSVTTGGGMTAGYGGLFDKRIAAVIPFNTGHVYWRGWGVRRSLADKITLWFVYNAIAPRKFIYAHEFSWEGEEGPQFPSVWVPAWPRYKKVYSLYGAEENLATTQGTGLLRAEKLTGGGCVALGPTQREPLYPVLNKWFGIPLPSAKDLDDITDLRVKYSGSRPGYPLLKAKESIRTKPESALLSITPEANARLDRKKLHEIALGMGRELLESARARRAQLELSSGRQALVRDLSSKLGDIQPNRNPEVKSLWMKKLAGAHVEAITLWPEPDIIVPLFIIKPETQGNKPLPLVIAIGEGGKDRFLRDRTRELERLLQNGIAVCLPDVRGTGETAPDQYNRSHDLATNMLELGETLLGLRLKDVLTVLVYLESRNDIDSRKIALWGDSFAPANTEEIWVDELEPQPVSPQIQHFASPMGAHLALLTALYHDEIKAVAARGGLISYLSALEDNFVYFPPDINVPEILKVGDISDICSSLAPRPLLIEGMVDSRNFVVNSEILEREMDSVKEAYKKAGEYKKLMIRQTSEYPEIVSWLIDQLI